MNLFIQTFGRYYFNVSPEEKVQGKKQWGISIIHPTTREKENTIVECLKQGKQNIETIAWKMGVEASQGVLKTQYHEYKISALEEFCRKTNETEFRFDTEEEIRKAYDDLLSIVLGASEPNTPLEGYGSVYIISSLFFLSKGKVPIYDYYANVAVKALLYDVCPQDVYVAQAPLKDQHSRGDNAKKSAMNMLLEYQRQLEVLAKGTAHFKNGELFISRELDQALWVYGHATKKWPNS